MSGDGGQAAPDAGRESTRPESGPPVPGPGDRMTSTLILFWALLGGVVLGLAAMLAIALAGR